MKVSPPGLGSDKNRLPGVVTVTTVNDGGAQVTNYATDLALNDNIPGLPTANPFQMVSVSEQVEAQSRVQREFSSSLVGDSLSIQVVREQVSKVAPTNAKVLITGETGTGKELTAKDIHLNSYRKDKPFIPANCAAIPEETIESVLFGHEDGAFTGAVGEKQGLFDAADGGTLFLDEVGELNKGLQTKLARVLEYGTFQRVGGTEEIKVDVRVIAATNCNLHEALSTGEMTRGLYDRLNVFHIHMPPLREHKEDIPLISKHLLEKHRNFVPDKVVNSFSPEALKKLESYYWPGNVRELENVIRRAIVLVKGSTIQTDDIALTTDEIVEKVLEKIEDIALSNVTVLVGGESGTGKELVARQIYQNSGRRDKPLLIVNCATLRENLAESELFGHVKGAFTGATKPHKGYFEKADGATLFLDHIEELDLGIQAKLLRAIQEGEILVMGTNKPKKVNVRIVVATNRNLEEAVKKGEFREDLYHRLSVIPIVLRPLRERREQIPVLAEQFLARFKGSKNIPGISREAMSKLTSPSYDWPGNVRELMTVMERAVILANEGRPLQADNILLDPQIVKVDSATASVYPKLERYLSELTQYACAEGPLDDAKLRFLALKYRIASMIVREGFKPVPEMKIAEELQIHRNTLREIARRFSYGSTGELVAELHREISSDGSNGNGIIKVEKPVANHLGRRSPVSSPAFDSQNLSILNNGTHPVLRKHLAELVEYASSSGAVDDYKARFLLTKCRILKVVIDSGRTPPTCSKVVQELGVVDKSLRNLVERFGYNKTTDLINELFREVCA